MTESKFLEKKPVAITKLAYGVGMLVSAELKFEDDDTEVLYFGKSGRGGSQAFQAYHPSFLDHLVSTLPVEQTVVEFRAVRQGRISKGIPGRSREIPREVVETEDPAPEAPEATTSAETPSASEA